MNHEEYHPPAWNIAAAVGSIGAGYYYFLNFAHFGLLHLLQLATGGPTGAVRLAQAAITAAGAAGVAGSVLAARRYTVQRGPAQLTTAFALCALGAALPLVITRPAMLALVAIPSGFGIGAATVTLAVMLRRAVGRERLGTCVGLGTGLAYGVSNLPGVFNASSSFQAVLAFLAACVGVICSQLIEPSGPGEKPTGVDYEPPGVLLWVVILLALVGLDTTAFYVIQHTPGLRENTWSGAPRLYANAAGHFLAAWAAGYALDRRWIGGSTLIAATLLLTAGFLLVEQHRFFSVGVIFYTAGVSAYSTVLVFYPARGARPGLTALVFAVAGWGGSAAGVVLAQGRSDLPGWLPVTTALAVGSALWARRILLRRQDGPAGR